MLRSLGDVVSIQFEKIMNSFLIAIGLMWPTAIIEFGDRNARKADI